MSAWQHQSGQSQRQDAVGAWIAVAVSVVRTSDEHVHGLGQRVFVRRVRLPLNLLADQPPHVDSLGRVSQVRVFDAFILHLDVLDTVGCTGDVQVDLEIDQVMTHVTN